MSKTLLRHTLIKQIFLTFLLTPYLYTFSKFKVISDICHICPLGQILKKRKYKAIHQGQQLNTNYVSPCFNRIITSSYYAGYISYLKKNTTDEQLLSPNLASIYHPNLTLYSLSVCGAEAPIVSTLLNMKHELQPPLSSS